MGVAGIEMFVIAPISWPDSLDASMDRNILLNLTKVPTKFHLLSPVYLLYSITQKNLQFGR